jgi:hypothetical protein
LSAEAGVTVNNLLKQPLFSYVQMRSAALGVEYEDMTSKAAEQSETSTAKRPRDNAEGGEDEPPTNKPAGVVPLF